MPSDSRRPRDTSTSVLKKTRDILAREWIEFIIVAVLLWLLMVVAISELELSSIS